MNILYQTQVTASGGRNGHVRSADGVLDLDLRLPKEMGGAGGAFTNPEQLFAAGYAACFENALLYIAGLQKIRLAGTQVDATVGIGPNDRGGFALAVKLEISLPEVPLDQAQALVDKAHEICPYSNATRGNVDVQLVLR